LIDVTILGNGAETRACSDVLSRAGFRIHYATEIEAGDHSPLILGEGPGTFALARQAVETGRHLLIACPDLLSGDRLSVLFNNRKRAQSLFVWNERRYHPGYRFVNSLIESDATWRPRYMRIETLSPEPTTSALARWRMLESIELLLTITTEEPVEAAATVQQNAVRNAPDYSSLRLLFHGLDAYLQVGMGEAVERRETLLAATSRKAYVDELNQSMPLRLVEDESPHAGGQARWLTCPAPSPQELARQQCLAFLDATLKANLAQDEATLWLRSLAVMRAMDQSLVAEGAQAEVNRDEDEPRFRLILGRALSSNPPSVA
jgi:hypothetical protein